MCVRRKHPRISACITEKTEKRAQRQLSGVQVVAKTHAGSGKLKGARVVVRLALRQEASNEQQQSIQHLRQDGIMKKLRLPGSRDVVEDEVVEDAGSWDDGEEVVEDTGS